MDRKQPEALQRQAATGVRDTSAQDIPKTSVSDHSSTDDTKKDEEQGDTIFLHKQVVLSQAPRRLDSYSQHKELVSLVDCKEAALGSELIKPPACSETIQITIAEQSTNAELPMAKQEPPAAEQTVFQAEPQLKPGDTKYPGQSKVTGIGEPQKVPEAEKSVLDSSADMLSGFMSKMLSGPNGPSKTHC